MNIDFNKCGGLVPAIIQDATTKVVLMLGYMNEEALKKTQETGLVTFFSRSRQCLWTKGETSGNYLHLVDIKVDCDNDTLLIQATPDGPTCHKGTEASRRDARGQLHNFALQGRLESHGSESGRGSSGTRHRSHERYQRAPHLRRFRHALPPHRAPDKQGPPHRRHGKGTDGTSQSRLEEALKPLSNFLLWGRAKS